MSNMSAIRQTEADGPYHPSMTRRQAKFCVDLINDRFLRPSVEFDGIRERYFAVANSKQASELIEDLKALPKLADTNKLHVPTETGIYIHPITDKVHKVINTAAGMRASLLVEIGGTRVTKAGEFVKFEWRSFPLEQIDSSWKVTEDRFHDFAVRYGFCGDCGRMLKAAESVVRGLGPVCAAR
jgi:hypothetical protein